MFYLVPFLVCFLQPNEVSTILFDTIDKDIVRLVSCASVNIFLTVDTQ